MAVVGLSEFTFGFAFLCEQAQRNWATLKAAPILPSLKVEEEQGWDAHLPLRGTDFYYQFKLSDYLSRSNAKYIRDGTYTAPYFRFSFHSNNGYTQHKRLRELSKSSSNTFYVAPEITRLSTFNDAFLSRRLTNASRLIPIADCDDIPTTEEDMPHHITFQTGDNGWRQHSEAKWHERSYTGEKIEDIYTQTEPEWQVIDRSYALRIYTKVVKAASTSLNENLFRIQPDTIEDLGSESIARMETTGAVLLRTSEILSTAFGAVLVLVGAKSDSPVSSVPSAEVMAEA